jgi:hypothetical protein
MRNWIRENYGWQTKKAEWAVFVLCLMFAAALVAAVLD